MKKLIKNKITILGFVYFISSLFLFSGIGTVNAQPTITATLKATPETYSGKCPAVIKFEGEIVVKNITKPPFKVQYKFLRSDGAFAPVQTLNFEKDGLKKVNTTWTLGGSSLPTYSGWEAIKVVYPQDVESNKANFKIECKAEAQKKPDLVIRSFGLKEWGKCEPKQVIFTFQVTVANIGTAPSPAIGDKALVQAMDQHGNGWGNGVMLGAISPGGSQTVMIPVYYLMDDPAHVTGAAPHPFKAIADPLKLVDELNEGNNESSNVINVDPRDLCRQKQKAKPQVK